MSDENTPFMGIGILENMLESSVPGQSSSVPAQIKTNEELGVKDPALTSQAFSNALDQFDLSQYTVKLSLKSNNDPQSSEERVIAQTAVTATQIDDITIKTLSSLQSAGEVTFKLFQPGHVTLMDDINRFRKELKLKPSVRPIIFLEINFKGYTTDYEDNDLGGVPTNIAGPYIYKLFITNIEININEEGSEYQVKTMIHNFYANTNAVAEIPVLTMTIGTTLEQCCKALEIAIKNYFLLEKPQYTVQDIYVINLDHPSLKFGSVDLKKGNINKAPGVATDSTNDDSADPNLRKVDGADGIEIENSSLTFQSGVKIEQFFLVMLSMIEAFKKEIARREDGNNPKSAPQPEKTFVKWFRVLTDVEEIKDGFDYYRNEYARKYTYTLQIVDTARTDIGQKDEIPDAVQTGIRYSDIKARGLLRKAYYYIFTGRNDQVKQLDISFSAGATLLNPPGTTLGRTPKSDYSAELSNLTSEAQAAYEAGIKAQLNYLENPGIVVGKVFLDAVTKFETLSGRPFRNYIRNDEEAWALERHRTQSLNAPDYVQAGTYFGFSNTLFGFTAYQYQMAALGSSLARVTMTVRGDPWYLGKRQWTGKPSVELIENRPEPGKDAYGNSVEGCLYGDHSFFYLQFANPRVSMENYADEDDDDGYWQFTNSNGDILQSFSGIYLLLGVTNTFSKGEFSSELQGTLMTELGINKLQTTGIPLKSAGNKT